MASTMNMFYEFVTNLGLKIERVVCDNPKPRGIYICFGVQDSEHALHHLMWHSGVKLLFRRVNR